MEQRAIVHMDLDSFFVSVELLKHPELKGKPLIVGSDQSRGVVASCSYEARKFGIHSAMPSVKARSLCPHVIFLNGSMDTYSKYSSIVTQIIAAQTPVYEKASIDEFYLDLSGMDRFFGCYKWATELRQKITKETGLPLSFGLSTSKMVSKVATGEAKPNGQIQILPGTEKAFLAPLPVGKIPMIGKKTEETLRDIGIFTVGALGNMSKDRLHTILGKNGTLVWQRANGVDNTPVVPHAERKSMSSEETFGTDTLDMKKIRSTLIKMTEELAFSLRNKNFLTGCITLKIRYSNFDTFTHQSAVFYTSSDSALIANVLQLFDKLYAPGRYIRLLGVRFNQLVRGNYQTSLFENPEKSVELYQAMDKIRNKYGEDAIGRAVGAIKLKTDSE